MGVAASDAGCFNLPLNFWSDWELGVSLASEVQDVAEERGEGCIGASIGPSVLKAELEVGALDMEKFRCKSMLLSLDYAEELGATVSEQDH